MEWLPLIKLAKPLLMHLPPLARGICTVNIRHQVTSVVCRNPDFGKRNIEDTLIEDILSLKMELLALMQMDKWLWGGRGDMDNFSQTILSSIISYLVGVVGIVSVERASE